MRHLVVGLVIVFIIVSCSTPNLPDRPREAWIIRSVLDRQPRIISLALNDRLWVAYNTQTGGLFKAWTGGIKFDGPVYTSAHGPQPTTQGVTLLEETDANPWRIVVSNTDRVPQVIYKGHSIKDGRAYLKYILSYQDHTISVVESPEFAGVENGKIKFERQFEVSGLPSNLQLKINVRISSVINADDMTSDGKLERGNPESKNVGGKTFQSYNSVLTLENGKTNFSVLLTPPTRQEPVTEIVSGEEAVFAIMAKSDCNTCHNKDVKTVGPSYTEIAQRYENSESRRNDLIEKIIKGGSGNWGDVPMTAHPNLARQDASVMVQYILDLDATEEADASATNLMPKTDFEIRYGKVDQPVPGEEVPGILINVYKFDEPVTDFPDINDEMLPVFSGMINALHIPDGDFGGLEENFVLHGSGFITVKKTTNVVFRLVSDDGSRLFIDNKLVVDNGGNHGLDPRDGEIILKAGKHAFRVEYFQGAGGKGLSLQWRTHDAKEFSVVPPGIFSYDPAGLKKTAEAAAVIAKAKLDPGDGAPLSSVHPSFDLHQARPDDFQPKVGGIDFLPDGRMVLTTWDSLGSVFLLDGVAGNDHSKINVKRIAFGLAEPLGVKVVDGDIYVLQKQELTRLIDHNADDLIDEYETICNGWRVSANFHEFAFGLLYKDGYFYGTLATAINPGGASTKPQIPDRGKVVKISRADGTFSLVASGLRTPNGIGLGVDNEIYIADNQGDWLPASKIIHFTEGSWYGSRSVDFEGTADSQEKPPVVWLPQDEIGNSPSQPAQLNVGPYRNQMIHGEVTHGGIKRVFAEKVNGEYQGAVFRFTQGLEAGVNRIVWGPDSALYIGGIGSTGNWGHYGKLSYGLQKIKYNGKPVFEMLAIRAQPDGVEIEFTQPLGSEAGNTPGDYTVQQWYYLPTENYGGPKMDLTELNVNRISVSADRRKVKLFITGMKERHVLYIHLKKATFKSKEGLDLWSTEAWYTMNHIPQTALP